METKKKTHSQRVKSGLNKRKKLMEFLQQSNEIEGVFDEDSLKQAKYAWDFLFKQKVINPGVVLKTHKILMLHQPLMGYERGYYRRVQVTVGGRYGLTWEKVPDAVEEWCDHMNNMTYDSKTLHVNYEKIHPFVDGNGRTGRMFMNWYRLKKTKEPLLIIHTGPEQWEYYGWFKEDKVKINVPRFEA